MSHNRILASNRSHMIKLPPKKVCWSSLKLISQICEFGVQPAKLLEPLCGWSNSLFVILLHLITLNSNCVAKKKSKNICYGPKYTQTWTLWPIGGAAMIKFTFLQQSKIVHKLQEATSIIVVSAFIIIATF